MWLWPMYFGRFRTLLTVTQVSQRSLLSKALQSVPKRSERPLSSANTGTMEAAAPTPGPAAPASVATEAAEEGSNGEAAASARPEWPWKRAKKVAVMISFAGKNYLGMQR